MEDYAFHSHVAACEVVTEETSSLELFHFSETAFNTADECELSTYDFENFLREKGQHAPSAPRYGVKLRSGLRLIVQKEARHAETFAPHVISLKSEHYEAMVETLRLPQRAIEATSVVGPFFWSSYSADVDDPRLHVIFRKSDTRRAGKTEGWEVILSHAFNTGLTTGFVKGTPSSHVSEALAELARSGAHHPLALPVLLLANEVGPKRDAELRATRDWVRKLEAAISQRLNAADDAVRGSGRGTGMDDVEETNRALVECHARVLRKRPADWLEILSGMTAALELFRAHLPADRLTGELEAAHTGLAGRLDFYRTKLRGIEGYTATTMERLQIQRAALAAVMAHRESLVNLQMVAMITDQRRIAQASKRDGNAVKRLSVLGAVFFPGTFLSGLFGMVFFQVDGTSGQTRRLAVAPQLWIYFAAMVPLTVVVVAFVVFWDRKRERRYKARARVLEDGLERMEDQVILKTRKAAPGTSKALVFNKEEDDYEY